MFNDFFKKVRDTIDLVRHPPGDMTHAMEITPENRHLVTEHIDFGDYDPSKYVHNGDFLGIFEGDAATLVPRQEFFIHYAFTQEPDPMMLTPVRTVVPLHKQPRRVRH